MLLEFRTEFQYFCVFIFATQNITQYCEVQSLVVSVGRENSELCPTNGRTHQTNDGTKQIIIKYLKPRADRGSGEGPIILYLLVRFLGGGKSPGSQP